VEVNSTRSRAGLFITWPSFSCRKITCEELTQKYRPNSLQNPAGDHTFQGCNFRALTHFSGPWSPSLMYIIVILWFMFMCHVTAASVACGRHDTQRKCTANLHGVQHVFLLEIATNSRCAVTRSIQMCFSISLSQWLLATKTSVAWDAMFTTNDVKLNSHCYFTQGPKKEPRTLKRKERKFKN
jgi:hypothetical protein